jgi:hypothetical protein
MLPLEGDLFETPTVLATTEGESSMSHSSHGSGVNSSQGHTAGSSIGHNSSRSSTDGTSSGTSTSKSRTTGTSTGTSVTESVTHSSSEGYAISRGRNRATTEGSADTRGTSRTRGTSEAFEAIYRELPSAVHSKENVLYMAAQTLRNLTAGEAFVNFVDQHGMHPGLLTVPDVQSFAPAPSAFEELRTCVLERSISATAIERASALIANREERLLLSAQQARELPEPKVPADFRVKKPRPAPEPKSPAEYRTKKTRPAKEEKGKE